MPLSLTEKKDVFLMKHKLFLELENRAPTNSPQQLLFNFFTNKSVADNSSRVGFHTLEY